MSGAVVFFTVFTLVYGAMGWVGLRVGLAAAPLQGAARALLIAWFALMTLAPVLGGILGLRSGVAAWITYVWFGFIFYLFLVSLPLAALKLVLPVQTFRLAFWLALAAVLLVCAWGVWNARRIEIKEIVIPVDLPNEAPLLAGGKREIRIAALSDLHLYSVEAESRLERTIAALSTVEYDVLVSLGDLVEADMHRANWERLAERMAAIPAPWGKFAVRGNHEAYADLASGSDIAERFHRAAGFVVLNDQAVDVGGALRIVGLDYAGYLPQKQGAPQDLFGPQGSRLPTLALKHLPDATPDSIGRFDLQLSGHTHAGQMWPFYYPTKMRFPYVWGLYELGRGSRLYTAPGTGVWGPPLRVGGSCEITLVRLVGRE